MSTPWQLLDILEARLHDVNAFVRSHALQAWSALSEQRAVPLVRMHKMMGLVVGRIGDKSSVVRKHAIGLLTTLMKCNPFGDKVPRRGIWYPHAHSCVTAVGCGS